MLLDDPTPERVFLKMFTEIGSVSVQVDGYEAINSVAVRHSGNQLIFIQFGSPVE